jgi:hypothetical protein
MADRKNHKKKLAAWKAKNQQDKNRQKKAQKEFIMNLIKQEQAKGMFENNPTISPLDNSISIEGPSI